MKTSTLAIIILSAAVLLLGGYIAYDAVYKDVSFATPEAVRAEDDGGLDWLDPDALTTLLSEKFGLNGLTLRYACELDAFMLANAQGRRVQRYRLRAYDGAYVLSARISMLTDSQSAPAEHYYTLDKRSGELITLDALFQSEVDFLGALNAEVLKQIYNGISKDSAYYIDEAGEPQAVAIAFDQAFCINENGLVVAFSPYTIASDGAWHEFTIPKANITDVLRSDAPIPDICPAEDR